MNHSHPDQPRSRKWPWIVGAGLIYLLPLLHLDGATDMFLKLNGIEGESADKTHAKEIEVLSWSRSRSNSSSVVGGSGKAALGDLSITKYTDKSTPHLLLRCLAGTLIPDGKLTIRKAGASQQEFFTYDMKDIYVTSVSAAENANDDRALEQISLAPDYINETYFMFDSNGKAAGQVSAAWTISTGGSTSPTITAIADTSTPEDTPKAVTFTIGDAESAAGALTLIRGSNNQTLVPTANIVFSGSGASRTATITPAADAIGSATITLTVQDPEGLTASSSFLLTVNAVNDAPTITSVTARTTNQDVPVDVSVTVADVDSALNSIAITGSGSPGGILSSVTDLTGSGAARTLRITPVLASSGTTTVTLTASDGSASSQTTFSLTVNSASGPNAITLAGNAASAPVSLAENTATDTDLGQFVAIDAPGTTHALDLVNSAGGRFKLGGAGGNRLLVANGTLLDFEASATHTIVIIATDLTNTSRTRSDAFTINLGNLNEAPLIQPPAFPTEVTPDTDTTLTGLTITDPDPGTVSAPFIVTLAVGHGTLFINASGPLSGKVTGNNTASLSINAPLSDISTVLAATGLRYHSTPGYTGPDTLTITANDQGTSGSGTPKTTTITPEFFVAFTHFTTWQSTRFSAAERANPALSGPLGHGDDDGVPNLVEYGLGTDPRSGSSGPQSLIETLDLQSGPSAFPAIRFPRRISDPTLQIIVEVATDLTNWQSGAAHSVQESVSPINADFEQVTIRTTLPKSSQGAQQMRIRFVVITPS